MNHDIRSIRKLILRDPTRALHEFAPDADDKTTRILEDLLQVYTGYKTDHKKLKARANELSREIGQALKIGQSASDHKRVMKQLSVQIREKKQNLTDAENRILELFDFAIYTDQQPPLPSGRTVRWKNQDQQNTGDVTVSFLQDDSASEAEWDAYARAHPASTLYDLSSWKKLIQKTYGHKCYYFIARNSEQHIAGVLPLIRLQSRLFGDFFISMPYFMTGGALADNCSIEETLIHAANTYAADLGLQHVEYRDEIPRESFQCRTDKVNMVLPLPVSHDALWNGFTPKIRAQIRRAQRENPRILAGGKELLGDFYTVYSRNMRDLGSPVHSKTFLLNILEAFPHECSIIVLYFNDNPVAAGYLLRNGDTLDIPLASTIRDFNHLSMNMLLYWEVLKYAIDRKSRFFNFGRSSRNSGTYRFKQQWGAEPKQLYWHYWMPSGTEPLRLSPDNAKYRLAIAIWKKLPLSLSRWLGPPIVKNLP